MYLKYLNVDEYDVDLFDGDTSYTVMFGSDKCGGTNKVYVIFKYKFLFDGEVEEKYLKNLLCMLVDEKVYFYFLEVNEDNTYIVFIDGKEERTGFLFEDFELLFNLFKEIDDFDDKKFEDWVDEDKILDFKVKKLVDWDEDVLAMILDMDVVKSDDWFDDESV